MINPPKKTIFYKRCVPFPRFAASILNVRKEDVEGKDILVPDEDGFVKTNDIKLQPSHFRWNKLFIYLTDIVASAVAHGVKDEDRHNLVYSKISLSPDEIKESGLACDPKQWHTFTADVGAFEKKVIQPKIFIATKEDVILMPPFLVSFIRVQNTGKRVFKDDFMVIDRVIISFPRVIFKEFMSKQSAGYTLFPAGLFGKIVKHHSRHSQYDKIAPEHIYRAYLYLSQHDSQSKSDRLTIDEHDFWTRTHPRIFHSHTRIERHLEIEKIVQFLQEILVDNALFIPTHIETLDTKKQYVFSVKRQYIVEKIFKRATKVWKKKKDEEKGKNNIIKPKKKRKALTKK